jgi:DNA-binding transcriptional LysR family regulator
MTLEQLRIFVGVAEREHVTAAARTLNVTQSAASAAIAALEERHAIKLFHRVGRGIALTEAGRAFLDEARGVLSRAAAAAAVLDEFSGLKRGSLRVVASQTIAAYWLPRILAAFHTRYPELRVDCAIGNTAQAAVRVQDGEADLGFAEGRVDDPALAHWEVGADRLVLVAAEPYTGKAISAQWLHDARWIMREPGSGTRSTLNDALRLVGVDPDHINTALVLPSNESVQTAVEEGAGVAVLSSLVVGSAIARGTLHALPFDFGRRAFFGLRHKERYRTRAADALLALMEPRLELGSSSPKTPSVAPLTSDGRS